MFSKLLFCYILLFPDNILEVLFPCEIIDHHRGLVGFQLRLRFYSPVKSMTSKGMISLPYDVFYSPLKSKTFKGSNMYASFSPRGDHWLVSISVSSFDMDDNSTIIYSFFYFHPRCRAGSPDFYKSGRNARFSSVFILHTQYHSKQ